MTASDYPHRTPDHNRVGLHYKPFRLIWLTSPFAIQPLARTKFLQPGLNPRSRAKRGYSRDHRPDCVQVNIALVVSREGMPLGYEIFAGNITDVTTVKQIVEGMESRFGKVNRVWVMDRGM